MTGLEAEKIPFDIIFSFDRYPKGWDVSGAIEKGSPKGCFTSLVQLKGPSSDLFPRALAEQLCCGSVPVAGVRTHGLGAASAGSFWAPASWGGLSLLWTLTVSLKRGGWRGL